MAAKIIDGKKIASEILQEIKNKITRFPENQKKPGLGVIIVGEDPASQIYVRSKVNKCNDVGIISKKVELPESCSAKELKKEVHSMNEDTSIHGILVQLPLPKQIDDDEALSWIVPHKDVDGFLPHNVGLLLLGRKGVISCTPKGIYELLKRNNIPTSGKNTVILGRSNIVGKPMAAILCQKGVDATVTICHSRPEKDIPEITRKADIIIAAMGVAKFVKADMIKEGSVIIDVGMNRTEEGLCGDVDFEACKEKASFITPVPGGVGPMTIAMLLENCLENYHTIEKI